MKQGSITYALTQLEAAEFVVKDEDVFRRRRPVYRLADPILRFHHVVTRRDQARFELRRTEQAWADAWPRFATHVLGPHFEHLAREHVRRFAPPSLVGGTVAEVGSATVNDPQARSQHELDVVALARDDTGGQRVLAIGEAKHTTQPRGLGDLRRLERIRALLEAAGRPGAGQARLLVFSVAGFDDPLAAEADARGDVSLLTLADLYPAG